MADELVFPANDALSLIEDLSSSMMNEAHDINPSFPQTEGSINIPEIIPPIISAKDTTKTFKQGADQSYTPISQLMKQTEELAATLDGPLNSNINEQINFNHMQSNSSVVQEPILAPHMQNPLVNNSINFVNPNSHVPPIQNPQNSQCLVIRGQRIPISAQHQHNSSVINIKHAPNANSPQTQTSTSHSMHSTSSINATNNLKQTMMVKVPLNQNPNTQNPNKPPMKGQIIKTPDQRLMFVTEVNGRRVGYLIQQPKQTNIPQTQTQRVQTPTHNVLNQHFDNRNNEEGSNINNDNTEPTNIDNHNSSTSEAINFTLDENKEIIMTHSENVNKVTEPLIKTDMKSLREKLLNLRNPLNSKNQLNLKSPLTFPSMSKNVEKLTDESVLPVDNPASLSSHLTATTINTATPIQCPPSISTDNRENMDIANPMSIEILSHDTDKEENNYSNEIPEEEEEGQEIEFSENDITAADFDDNPTDQSCSPEYEMGEDDVNNDEINRPVEVRSRSMSTDDEDSVPLAMLKNDNNEGSVSPSEGLQVESPPKPKKGKNSKKVKQAKNSVASLKKGEGEEPEGKSKKKGKSKVKKKKDSRKPKKPIIAYQLFFRDVQKDVRAENPQLNFGEISKEVSKKWEALEEPHKKKYHDSHEAGKLEYVEKLKAYKELIAQEKAEACVISSPTSPHLAEFHSGEGNLPEDTTPKKKAKRGRKRKVENKSPVKKKEFTFVETKDDFDSSFESREGIDEQLVPMENEGISRKEIKIRAPRKQLKTTDKQELDNPPSSPSLPSSASSSEDEEDSETAITRIREKAAELHKYLKQQRIVVTQKKSKQPGKKLRPTKTEVKEVSVGDMEEVEVEDKAEVEVDVSDEMEEITHTHMDHVLKICMKEEGLNVVKEDIEGHVVEEELDVHVQDDEVTESAEEDEVTDTVMEDEMKDTVMEEDSAFAVIEENSKFTMKVELEDDVMEEEACVLEDKDTDSVTEEGVNDTVMEDEFIRSKKLTSNDDSENDDSSDDEQLSCFRRKKSSRIKKLEEPSASESEDASLRLRKRRPLKNIVEETLKSESDEESTRSRRRKSTRKKKLDDTTKSDSEEESSNLKEHVKEESSNLREVPIEKHTNEKEQLPEFDSEEELSNLRDLSSRLKEQNTVELKEDEMKTPVVDTPTPKIEEVKGVVAASEPLKNTFRIPKKSGSNNENGLMAFRGPRICIRQSCEKPAVTSRERGGQYCGNECLVLYCREVFESWVIDREMEEKNKT